MATERPNALKACQRSATQLIRGLVREPSTFSQGSSGHVRLNSVTAFPRAAPRWRARTEGDSVYAVVFESTLVD